MDHFLLEMAVKGAMVLAATAAVAAALKDSSAAARHLTWTAGLAAAVSLPLLERVLPVWGVAILPAAPRAAAPASGAATAALEGSRWLLAVWAAGAAAVGAAILAGRLHVAWLGARSERLDRGPWPALVTALSGEIGLSRRVSVRRIDRPVMPMVWGVLRPVLLLPAAADAWPAALRRDVVLHELAHVKRHDALAQLVARLACALHWFDPLAWIAARRLRIERERACDDQVLELGARPCDYAEHLLTIARGRAPARMLAPALEMASRSALGERLAALLDRRRRRGVLSSRRAIGALGGAAVLVLPLAAVRPEAAPPPAMVAVAPHGPGIVPPPPSVNAGVAEKARKPARKPARKAAATPPVESGHDAAFAAPVVAMAPIEVRVPRLTASWAPAGPVAPTLVRRRVTVRRQGGEAAEGICEDEPAPSVLPIQLVSRTPRPATP